jgi:hypothetical protein
VAQADEPVRVYVFAGQSNMVGAGTSTSELATMSPASMVGSSGVIFWGPFADFPMRWSSLQAPTEILQPRSHAGFGPEIGAGPLLGRKHPDSTIAIVKFAESGTSLARDWDPDRPGGHYRRMISRVRTAVRNLRSTRSAPVRLAGFFWMQGESDSELLEHADAYEDNLSALVREVRSDLKAPRLPFVVGRINDLRRDVQARYRYSDIVRRAQVDVARRLPDTYMVSTDGLQRSTDRIHFSSRGTLLLGRRFVGRSFPL